MTPDVPRPSSHLLPLICSLLPAISAAAADPPIASEPPRRVGDLPERRTDQVTGGRPAVEVRRIDLIAVEPRTADRGPLDASLRWVQPGLQMPTGYRQVYRLENGGFMRADGGLAATFEQSIYQPSSWGDLPVVPASTVFVIGGVPLGAESGHGRLLGADPLDPGAVPRPFGPTATPDAAHEPSAVPGDRRRRFGFGPGHRMPDRVDPEGHEGGVDTSGSRFLRDDDYRSARLASRLAAWRAARRVVTRNDPSSGDSTTVARPTPGAAAPPSDSAP